MTKDLTSENSSIIVGKDSKTEKEVEFKIESKQKRKVFLVTLLVSLLLMLFLTAAYLLIGRQSSGLSLFPLGATSTATSLIELVKLRLIRLSAIYLIAILLASSGFLVQLMTRNPIAEMSTLGISGGASLSLAILLASGLSISPFISSLLAIFGAFIVLLLLILLNFNNRSNFQSIKLVLVGTSLGILTTSLASSITFASNQSQSYFLWIIGSFSAISIEKLQILSIFTGIFIVLLVVFGNRLKMLAFSDEIVISLGISVNRLRFLLLFLVAIASGISVATVGVISFVGLIAPQISYRLLKRRDFWPNLTLSSLIAINLLLASDFLAKNLFYPFEFPAACLTLLIGAIFFVLIIRGEAV